MKDWERDGPWRVVVVNRRRREPSSSSSVIFGMNGYAAPPLLTRRDLLEWVVMDFGYLATRIDD
jgi:hypothetical protein